MKKYLLSLAVMAMGATLLTGCLGDDSKGGGDTPTEILVTKGAFVINNGNYYQAIDGSLTYFDATTGAAEQNVYKKVNGKSLGGTPNDVLVYGQKVYIVGSDENTIFVLDVRNFKELAEVSTTELLGDAEGLNPRRIAAYEDKVYFTTYGGYVAAIDTISISLKAKYQVGSYPEGLALGASPSSSTLPAIYVANSDGVGGNGDISVIDIMSGTVTSLVVDKVKNPQEILVAGSTLYVLDFGYYDETGQKDAGVYKIDGNNVKLVVPNATGMTGYGNYIFTFNDPWDANTAPSYSIYDIENDTLSSLYLYGDTSHPILSPCAISIDPNPYSERIFIASRQLDPDSQYQYPSYAMPGFVNVYGINGQYAGYFDAGVEPHKIEFSYGTQKIVY